MSCCHVAAKANIIAAVGCDDALAATLALDTRFRLPVRCRPAYCQRLGAGERDGRSAMAKGQKRSNREPKKPKADKKKTLASTGTAPGAKPKPGGAKAETKTLNMDFSELGR
jgi:hypothetical protein